MPMTAPHPATAAPVDDAIGDRADDVLPSEFADPDPFEAWRADWQARGPDFGLALRVNPVRIPRNHRIQQVIDAGVAGDFQPFHRLNRALATPFDADPEWDDLCLSPKAGEEVRVTFCGT